MGSTQLPSHPASSHRCWFFCQSVSKERNCKEEEHSKGLQRQKVVVSG